MVAKNADQSTWPVPMGTSSPQLPGTWVTVASLRWHDFTRWPMQRKAAIGSRRAFLARLTAERQPVVGKQASHLAHAPEQFFECRIARIMGEKSGVGHHDGETEAAGVLDGELKIGPVGRPGGIGHQAASAADSIQRRVVLIKKQARHMPRGRNHALGNGPVVLVGIVTIIDVNLVGIYLGAHLFNERDHGAVHGKPGIDRLAPE